MCRQYSQSIERGVICSFNPFVLPMSVTNKLSSLTSSLKWVGGNHIPVVNTNYGKTRLEVAALKVAEKPQDSMTVLKLLIIDVVKVCYS